MRRLVLTLLFLGALLAASPASARPAPWIEGGPSKGEDLHIYLLTFGVGDDIASWFGHTALLVRDERLMEERVYNYGMFSFGPDMLPKFLMGRLEFWVGEASAPRTLELYESLDRDIYRSELNLTPNKRREMAAFLAWNVLPANRDYLYHHYFDNCATRIRDGIDKAVGGQLANATKDPSRTTFRGHTHRHTERNTYIDLLLSLWMNDEIDTPLTEWEDMFLPGELLAQIEALEYTDETGNRRRLVPKTEIIYKSERPKVPNMPSSKWWWTWLIGVVLGGAGFHFARKWETTGQTTWKVALGGQHFLVGMLFGIPGLVAVLFHFTEHTITWWNENLLLWSPLTFMALLLSVPIMRGSKWALRTMRMCWYAMAATSLLALPLELLPSFDQQNGFALAMFVPFNLLMAAAMHRFGPPTKRGGLESIGDDIWSVTSDRRFLDLKVGARMVIVKLSDGRLWVHSPLALDDELKAAMDELGEVAFLIGPNTFHHMHLGEWIDAYPDAVVFGPAALRKKRDDIEQMIALTDEAVDAWSEDLEHLLFGGSPLLSEAVFFHKPSKTLIVADLLQNMKERSSHLPTRIYQVLTLKDGLAVDTMIKVTFTDKAAARASLDAVLEWDFEQISVCHGKLVAEDAHETLRRAYEFLD